MTILEIILKRDVIAFRERALSSNDVLELIRLLEEGEELTWFREFIAVRASLPMSLLKPILAAGIRHQDVSDSNTIKRLPYILQNKLYLF